MANNDLFAPPTPDEMKLSGSGGQDLFAPPSKAEMALGQKPQAAQAPGRGQTFLEHAGNALSFGYLPQLQALAEKPMTGALNLATGNDVKADDYLNARDSNIQRLQAEEAANPKSALAGTAAGTITGALATPLPEALAGKGLIGGAAKGAIYGAGVGAAANPGDTEGEINPIQGKERLENAGTGAKLGAITGGVGGLVSKAAAAAQDFAATKAFKGSGAMLKDFRTAAAKGQVQDMGQFMLDKGLIKAGDTFEDVADKTQSFNKSAGSRLEQAYSKAEKNIASMGPEQKAAMDSVGFNPVRDKDEILKAAQGSLGDSVGGQAAVEKLSGYMDQLGEKYGNQTLDPKKANDIKGAIDDAINYARNPLSRQPEAEQAFQSARKFISSKIDAHIDAIGEASGDAGALGQLKEANKDYGYSAQLSRIAKDKINRESANRMFGLTDTIAGSAAGGVGGMLMGGGGDYKHAGEGALIGGLMGAMGNKLGRTYGNGLLAAGANNAGPVLNAASHLTAPAITAEALAQRDNKKKPQPKGQDIPLLRAGQ